MKGIVLAGGSGTRLYPITKGVSKQLIVCELFFIGDVSVCMVLEKIFYGVRAVA